MKLKLFCAKCGFKLKRIKESSYFDRLTGKEYYTYFQQCPNFSPIIQVTDKGVSTECTTHDKLSEQSEKYKQIVKYYKDERRRLKFKNSKKKK